MKIFNKKRISLALLISVLLHGVLIAGVIFVIDHYYAQQEGIGGFERASGLNITLGDIQRVDEILIDSQTETNSRINEKIQSNELAIPTQSQNRQITGSLGSGETDQDAHGGSEGELQAYYAEIMNILNKHKYYNKLAKERALQGIVVIRFSISSNGNLINHELIKSSGEFLLDRSAEKMLLSSVPFPPFPENLEETSISIELPVEYTIQEKP